MRSRLLAKERVHAPSPVERRFDPGAVQAIEDLDDVACDHHHDSEVWRGALGLTCGRARTRRTVRMCLIELHECELLWEGQDSNLRRLRRRFYRPLPLAARAPSRERIQNNIAPCSPGATASI